MTPENIERMAREAGMHQDGDSWYCVGPGKYDDHDVSTEALTRFAALVRAHAESEAHAAIDASPAKIIRNTSEGYPGGRTPRDLTLVDRIKQLSQYAADWKRWCMEAEEAAKFVRAQALEDAARVCESARLEVDAFARAEYNASIAACQCATAIRALAGQPSAAVEAVSNPQR